MKRKHTIALLAAGLLAGLAGSSWALTPMEELGRFLYFDANLSTPPGQACADCHHPTAGFADPDYDLPVSRGVLKHRFGNRNSPTSAYMSFSPDFYWDIDEEMYIGGQFWDGRAANLVEQAKGPFLNILEMNNPNKLHVVTAVHHSSYAGLFYEVFGEDAFENYSLAYDRIAEAIAAFEGSEEVNTFTSKYDYYLLGQVELTPQELLGLQLFDDPMTGNCAACHPSVAGPYSPHPLFTDYSYDNLGVPKNWQNPFLFMPRKFNPDGSAYTDFGLGAVVGSDDEMGKFKVPTLRNIAVTPPYMHNGIFATLHEVANFYNTRDVPGMWPPPEVPENVNTDEMGNLNLTPEQVDAICAFLLTLTDGFEPDAGIDGLAADEAPAGVPGAYDLAQNYPNPFNPSTTISFTLPVATDVRLSVYNSVGQQVATLLKGALPGGLHTVTFDGSGFASGVYFYRIDAGSFTSLKKMLLMK